jgi:protein phosphatase 1E
MTKIQQANLRMTTKRSQSSILRLLASWLGSTARLVIACFLSILALVFLLYLQTSYPFSDSITRGGQNKGTEGTAEVANKKLQPKGAWIRRVKPARDDHVPELPKIPVPPLDPVSRQPLNITAVDDWASMPIFGSYLHRQGDNTMTRIHMPLMDLESTYKRTPPDLESLYPEATSGRSFSSPDCIVLTRKGNKFSHTGVSSNQDRIATLDYVSTNGDIEEFWMGLFDGHGELGHVISHFTLSEFPDRLEVLRQQSLSIEDTKTALKELFLAVNDNLPHLAGSGSTGISIWKHQGQLYISNVGDSKAFLVGVDSTRKKVNVIYTTKPHKPDSPDERKRIEGMGGRVQAAPAPGYSARLLIPLGESPLEVVGLAMSRSLGDFDGHPHGLIAEPTTDAIALVSLDPALDYLVILASDGLLDKISEIEIAKEMAQSQLLSPKGKFMPLEAAEYLILKSSAAWKKDFFGQGYRDESMSEWS